MMFMVPNYTSAKNKTKKKNNNNPLAVQEGTQGCVRWGVALIYFLGEKIRKYRPNSEKVFHIQLFCSVLFLDCYSSHFIRVCSNGSLSFWNWTTAMKQEISEEDPEVTFVFESFPWILFLRTIYS